MRITCELNDGEMSQALAILKGELRPNIPFGKQNLLQSFQHGAYDWLMNSVLVLDRIVKGRVFGSRGFSPHQRGEAERVRLVLGDSLVLN